MRNTAGTALALLETQHNGKTRNLNLWVLKLFRKLKLFSNGTKTIFDSKY